jgi:hypothetical protein
MAESSSLLTLVVLRIVAERCGKSVFFQTISSIIVHRHRDFAISRFQRFRFLLEDGGTDGEIEDVWSTSFNVDSQADTKKRESTGAAGMVVCGRGPGKRAS